MLDWTLAILILAIVSVSAFLPSPSEVGGSLNGRHVGRMTRSLALPIGDRRPRRVSSEEGFGIRLLAALARWEIVDPISSTTVKDRETVEDRNVRYVRTSPTAVTGPGLNLSNDDLTGRDLSNADLGHAIFANSVLQRANLTRANLAGAVFNGADLRGAILVRVNAMSALFIGANLGEVDLSWSNFMGANLRDANLENVILDGVTWSQQTVWPAAHFDDVRRRSTQVGPETWRILPVESEDRLLV